MAVQLKEDLYYVGVCDPDLRVFDIIMYTPYGTTYNAYLLLGSEKTCLIETAKERFSDTFIENVRSVLSDNGRDTVDYVIHNHTEPDHSGSLSALLATDLVSEATTVIGTDAAKTYLEAIHNKGREDGLRIATIDELGGKLSLGAGSYDLEFYAAPFLHWPDSMFTYVPQLGALFTCDVFGSHYAPPEGMGILDTGLVQASDVSDFDDAFKYYYDCIFGPFKKFVMDGLGIINKNILESGRPLEMIGTSHGPVLTTNGLLQTNMEIYEAWSREFEEHERLDMDKVTICYVSAYGYTKGMAEEIARGVQSEDPSLKVGLFDVTYTDDESILASEIMSSKGILFGTSTILADALPTIYSLTLKYVNPVISKGQVAGSFGSYGWSGEGALNINQRLSEQLRLEVPLEPLRVRFRPSEKAEAEGGELQACFDYGRNFARAVRGRSEEIDVALQRKAKSSTGIATDDAIEDPFGGVDVVPEDGLERSWRCVVCGMIETGTLPPNQCDACGAIGFESWENLGVVAASAILETDTGAEYEWKCSICGLVEVGPVPPSECPICGPLEPEQWERLGTVTTGVSGDAFTGRLVIVGGGAAGISAAEAAREAAPEAEILIIAEEEGLPYNRPNVSKTPFVGVIKDRQWFVDNGIQLFSGYRATLDPVEGVVMYDTKPVPYDKVVLATGSSARDPFSANEDYDNVFAIHSDLDAAGLVEAATKDGWEHVTVVGGGILGLELADLLHRTVTEELQFTIVDIADTLLQPYLRDSEASAFFIDRLPPNVNLRVPAGVESFEGEGGVATGVVLDSGEHIKTDGVIIAVSTQPQLSALGECHVAVESGTGIIVNEKMETSIPNVFAAGDVAAFNGQSVNNWENALVQGRIAGLNAVEMDSGSHLCFEEFPLTYHMDVFGTEMWVMGNWVDRSRYFVLTDASTYHIRMYTDPARAVTGVAALGHCQTTLLSRVLGMDVFTVLKHAARLLPK